MNRVPLTPARDRLDRLLGRLLDFLAGAAFVCALFALGFFLNR